MDAPRINAPEWTVSELSAALKKTVEDAYGFVRVRGELGNVKYHSSGHVYLDLKDDKACIGGVIWRGVASRVRVKLEAGLEVVATGRLTTYPGQSKYQIVIDSIEPAGLGALMALVEQRKKALAAEGLFDPARKQLLPFLPKVIGVVTSPTGAVIRDILHRLSDRFPRHVVLWPVRVQGDGSAAEVAAAIRGFNALPEGGRIPRPDVIIVARGGGSLEDLWSFNEEIVVRAAADSLIPLISAVGHETDVTLIDFAADIRAPTPTAAAELAVPVRTDLLLQVDGLARRSLSCWRRAQEARHADLRAATRALPTAEDLLSIARQRLDIGADRMPRALRANAQIHHTAYSRISGRLTLHILRRRVADERRALALLAQRSARSVLAQSERRQERFGALANRLLVALRANAQARRDLIARSRERIAVLSARAALAMRAGAERRASRIGRAAGLLAALSYHGVLARGFALVRGADGAMVRSAAKVSPTQRLDIEFADGHIKVTADGSSAKEPRARTGKTHPKDEQGDLF